MDGLESNFKILAAKCDSRDSPELYKALLSIKEVIDSPEYNSKSPRFREFRDNGSTEHLIRALSASNNKSILNITVSILGDICTVSTFVNELAVLNVLRILSSKLSKLTLEDDSLIGRIYRLLGNLCKKKGFWGVNIVDKRPTIVEHIVCTLKAVADGTSNVTSEATITMGVRCIREFLNKLTIIMLVTKYGVLKPLGLMLIKYSKTWNQNHEHENILYNVIKALYQYSKFKCHHLITELKNIEQGNSLLCLSDVLLISPKNIVKIVMNLLRITQLQSELPIPEICQGFMELLPNGKFMIEGEYEEYIQCICYLFEHPANRNSNRCGRNIPLLINTLKHFQEASDWVLKCSFLIISTLNKCKYNKALIIEQLDNGIIEVLTEKLEWFIDTPESFNFKHEYQRRKSGNDVLTMDHILAVTPNFVQSITYRDSERRCNTRLGDIVAPSYVSMPISGVPLSPSSPNTDTPNNDSILMNDSESHGSWISCDSLVSPGVERPSSAFFPAATLVPLNRRNNVQNYSPRSNVQYITPSDHSYDYYPSSPSSLRTCNDSPSPSSSPCSSGQSDMSDVLGVFDSDDYSPVCSDDDQDVYCNDDLMEIDPEKPKVDVDIPSLASSKLKTRLMGEMIHALRNYLNSKPPHPSLVSSNLLIVLLKCYHFNHSKYELLDVILRILGTSNYLIPLMLTDFVQRFLELTKSQHTHACSTCNHLRDVRKQILESLTNNAQSAVGDGAIAFRLLRANEDVKVKLVLLIPYIVKTRSLLLKFMIYCRGLEVLLKVCQNDELKLRGIKVLCKLAGKTLGIANPRKVCQEPIRCIAIDTDDYRLGNQSSDTVTFKLDDGTSVLANRQFLSSKSDYFNTLFNGSFKESKEDEIHLSDIDNKTLKILLYLMYRHWDNPVTETLDTNLDLETLLDAARQCDKFLLNDLCVVLTNSIEQLKLSPETVSRIYQWSIESGTNLLRVEAVAFALVVNVPNQERFTMFNSLFSLGYTEVLVDDIQKLLDRYLKSEPRGVHKRRKIGY